MKKTEIIMGMPITVEVVDDIQDAELEAVFDYFREVDRRFSTYKKSSEISKINKGLAKSQWSSEMINVLELCQQTKELTGGFFDIEHRGQLDPSGLVKGWAIDQAATDLLSKGFQNFYIEAGGDIQVHGYNPSHDFWSVGIRNPFDITKIIKVLKLTNQGIATSGTYIRGQHIYNPWLPDQAITAVQSLTVVGPNVYEADRYATAAFAMAENGILFLEAVPGLDGYMVRADKTAVYTSGFEGYIAENV